MYAAELTLAKNAIAASAKFLNSLDVLSVDSAEGKDIKLEADRKSEEVILNILAQSQIPVLTEESGALGRQSALRWIIDPIDGTYNFFRGAKDLSCISIALWEGSSPLLGVVYRLGTNTLFTGNALAKEAFINDSPIKTSSVTDPEKAAFATGFPVYMDYSESHLQKYIAVTRKFKKVRMLGSATLMSTFVGAGYFDVYSEKSIKLWDVAAGVAITLAAGGDVCIHDMGDNKLHIALCANSDLLSSVSPFIFS